MNYISWEHYEADRDATVWDYVHFGLVFTGTIVLAGLAILIL